MATAAEYAGWLSIRDDVRCSSIIRVHMQHSRAQHSAFFAQRYETLNVLDSLPERKFEKFRFGIPAAQQDSAEDDSLM